MEPTYRSKHTSIDLSKLCSFLHLWIPVSISGMWLFEATTELGKGGRDQGRLNASKVFILIEIQTVFLDYAFLYLL